MASARPLRPAPAYSATLNAIPRSFDPNFSHDNAPQVGHIQSTSSPPLAGAAIGLNQGKLRPYDSALFGVWAPGSPYSPGANSFNVNIGDGMFSKGSPLSGQPQHVGKEPHVTAGAIQIGHIRKAKESGATSIPAMGNIGKTSHIEEDGLANVQKGTETHPSSKNLLGTKLVTTPLPVPNMGLSIAAPSSLPAQFCGVAPVDSTHSDAPFQSTEGLSSKVPLEHPQHPEPRAMSKADDDPQSTLHQVASKPGPGVGNVESTGRSASAELSGIPDRQRSDIEGDRSPSRSLLPALRVARRSQHNYESNAPQTQGIAPDPTLAIAAARPGLPSPNACHSVHTNIEVQDNPPEPGNPADPNGAAFSLISIGEPARSPTPILTCSTSRIASGAIKRSRSELLHGYESAVSSDSTIVDDGSSQHGASSQGSSEKSTHSTLRTHARSNVTIRRRKRTRFSSPTRSEDDESDNDDSDSSWTDFALQDRDSFGRHAQGPSLASPPCSKTKSGAKSVPSSFVIYKQQHFAGRIVAEREAQHVLGTAGRPGRPGKEYKIRWESTWMDGSLLHGRNLLREWKKQSKTSEAFRLM